MTTPVDSFLRQRPHQRLAEHSEAQHDETDEEILDNFFGGTVHVEEGMASFPLDKRRWGNNRYPTDRSHVRDKDYGKR